MKLLQLKNSAAPIKDGRFFNPQKPGTKSLVDVLKWSLGTLNEKWPQWIENPVTPRPPLNEHAWARTTLINHATVLVETQQGNFLTDPHWSERTSPFDFVGPKRHRSPGLNFNELPVIDFVLVSHNHFDHMDKKTLQRLQKKFDPHFFVALGDARWLKAWGIDKVTEMDWWTQTEFRDFKISFTPAQHWSRRSLNDTNASLWGGFVIEWNNQKLFFAGDTGWGEHFSEIFNFFGAPRLALLPIGAYEPRWFMKAHHMNPEEAFRAHLILQAEQSLAIHFGNWQLTAEAIDAPEKALAFEIAKNPKASVFHCVKNSEWIEII
jgi:L-ascorbate metabolism protein UlaG (beta-lactamase superfamily)